MTADQRGRLELWHAQERAAALEVLRRDDAPFGAAVRAIARVEALGLQPLEAEVAGTVVEGWGQEHGLMLYRSLATDPIDHAGPHADASNRLEQVMRILSDAGYWPQWS